MPFAPPHPCNHPGCKELTTQRYCPAHTKQVRQEAESRRTRPHGGSVYGRRWRERSKAFLRRNPLCADPYGFHQGRPVPADCVDHIIPHKGDMTLFWDENNWQGLCSAPCHSYKTATEDGGFGARRSMVTFVCGAPGSGKSTYVREHWRPGDLIWDFDAVVQAITGLSSHEQLDKTTMAFMLAMRDGFYLKAQREQDKRIWIIESCPTRQERMDRKQRFNAKVVLLNTDIETCRQRIAARGDSWSLERLQWWFDRYESD